MWIPKMPSASIFFLYLDGFGGLHALLRGNFRFAVPQQLLNEIRDVPSGDWDVLDAAANNVAFRLHNARKKSGHDLTIPWEKSNILSG